MGLQRTKSKSKLYALLPSGVLIVEPRIQLLAARAQFLLAADHYVAASSDAASAIGLQRNDVRVAILSQSLGDVAITTLAREIRLHYPKARILIFGTVSPYLGNQLYDDSIDDRCRPEQLLDALFRLTQDPSERMAASITRTRPQSLSLAGLSWLSLHNAPAESDPSKAVMSTSEESPTGDDVPSDETSPHFI
jgi:hypothetical protein